MNSEDQEKKWPACPPFKCRLIRFYGEDVDDIYTMDVTQDTLDELKKYIECIEESMNV